jgi:hypothetical protein
MDAVAGDGQYGPVVQESEQDDHDSRDRAEIGDKNGEGHEQKDANRLGNAVSSAACHSPEDLAALVDRVDGRGKTGGQQHDGRRRDGSRASLDNDIQYHGA